ncbi:MAG: prepilin peptidase [Nanoarchaeota archaeon]
MDEVIFLFLIALIWIVIASIQDLKKREVDNWVSFSLIIFALGFRFFYSLFNLESLGGFWFFYSGLIWLGIFYVIGYLFYYSKLFAGGDAKLMIALGSVLPLNESFSQNLIEIAYFILIFLLVGFFYSLFWSLTLMFRNFKEFKKKFFSIFEKQRKFFYPLIFLGIVAFILGFFEVIFFLLGAFILIFPLVFAYSKAIEETCMIKKIRVQELREGDWLVGDIKIGKSVIKSRWEGLTLKEIKLIRKKLKNIYVKEGIPFVPVFLISFIIWIFYRVL